MSNPDRSRLLRPETLTAIGIFVAAAVFIVPTFDLPPMAALLPAAMLVSLMILAAFLLVNDQRKAAAGEPAETMTRSPKRVALAFGLVVLYALSVDFIGFYVSTAISVPLVAYVFGFRNPVGLATATVIVLAAIYLIFSIAMSQEFPAGRLWGN
ncbi:tripartite tricarboxylate transporter TctB family protein [Paracoccus sp. SCSIO 75233]|uniref:tripartite tricarboxylate transporter TctB family protein n=1 Tax=Paracoccus sp. SCSIO 75233 TaxID=3017782 RepID=UPI0022F12E1B|nr:tripartite tricarboxylate transporter TctB family protein [Paracoccus sp. SCSIO 75233]WBU53980.1 tripartite tricarboxylate transporter TctB family protein [Paracoccus sp. SCSIO 75233]